MNLPESSFPNLEQTSLLIADHVDAMLAYWDKDLICRFANTPYKVWFGKSHEELIDKMPIRELLGEELFKKNQHYIEDALKGIPQHFEREIRVPSGELRHVLANYHPHVRDGQVLGFIAHVVDVTEINRLHRELQQTNEIARIGSWEYDLCTGQILWSKVTRDLHGVPADYIPTLDGALSFYAGDGKATIATAIERTIATGAPYDLELKVVPMGGNEKWVRAIGKGEFKNGVCVRLFGTFQDIDERKRLEEELRENRERFQNAFQYSGIGMAMVSLQGQWMQVNDKLCRIIGYTHAELESKTFQEITHPDDLDNDLQHVRQLLDSQATSYYIEKRYLHKLGHIIWANLTVSLVRNAERAPLYFVSQIEDITARKKALEDLTRVNRELKTIIDSGTHVSIITTDINGLITHFSKGAETLLGYTAEEVTGIHTPAIIHSEAEVKQRERELHKILGKEIKGFDVFVQYARLGDHETREWTYIKKDGSSFPVQLVVTAIRNDKEEISGFLGIATDLTERKLAEESIRKYNELAIKNKEMEQFTYVASHDLREPLVTISRCAEMLRLNTEGQMDEQNELLVNYISASAERMNMLIKGLMEYSRIGSDRSLQQVDCGEVLKEALDDLAIQIRETNATINIGTLPVIKGYHTEFRQLLQHLISNAIKFRRPDIDPHISIDAVSEGKIWHFTVTDNGIGIRGRDTEKIFIIFKRLHNSDDIDGSGIGLAHCKKIVEMHGGSIWVKSVANHGSTFHFTIDTLS